jgi:hypothetical protein
MDRFAEAVQSYAKGQKKSSKNLVVTYVLRNEPRRLDPAQENELLEKIRQIPSIDLQIVDFAKLSFPEQVQIAANTDILLGVHGNGMSHTLFLPQGAALIEIFPENTFRVEYWIFAKIRKLDYFGWVPGRGWLEDEKKKAFGGTVDIPVKNVDIDAIVSVIKDRAFRRSDF